MDVLTHTLPDAGAARRFLSDLELRHPAEFERAAGSDALMSDLAALAAFSPLMAITLLEDPGHIDYLRRRRKDSGVRSKEELVEALAQFKLTSSGADPHRVYSSFRRRELMRVFLRDIRHLATIAEVTEEISNLADAILEDALALASREVDARFGRPQKLDERGRATTASFCVISLGKLGSRELNYSSDIDLLFMYECDGTTGGGGGSREAITNHEYFSKLSEHLIRLVGERAGETGAYRVDLRLRPHGSLGPIVLSIKDTVKYYRSEARMWERQVLIRSRVAAGDAGLFRAFYQQVEATVFARTDAETALASVRESKLRIDSAKRSHKGYDVKLGKGGIREIEFIAQALQLAFGADDEWLRSPHTLISLARLADRGVITETELTELSAAYEFLRRVEHLLQMENGLQTHTVPDEVPRRELLARKTTFVAPGNFDEILKLHTGNVERIFERIFGTADPQKAEPSTGISSSVERTRSVVARSLEKSSVVLGTDRPKHLLDEIAETSPRFSAMIAAQPRLIEFLPESRPDLDRDYTGELLGALPGDRELGGSLAQLRRAWSKCLIEIAVADIRGLITIEQAKTLQTGLAEAALNAAMAVVKAEMARKFGTERGLGLGVLALGKLGGRGVDYDSDLDLLCVYADEGEGANTLSPLELYARAVEMLVNVLSSVTRDGALYRVDLRLRPYGSKGVAASSLDTFLAYLTEKASVWEMLAFVKLRAVGGHFEIAERAEVASRTIIHERAGATSPDELRGETLRIREELRAARSRRRRSGDIDIKYGEGGMLDVYFATRYLQLRDNVPDTDSDRSTRSVIGRLLAAGSLDSTTAAELDGGYALLSRLDHNIRLSVGRRTRVPMGNEAAMAVIARRMGYHARGELIHDLSLARLSIRAAYERILG